MLWTTFALLLHSDSGLTFFKMEKFRACWKAHNNDERTSTKDVEPEK